MRHALLLTILISMFLISCSEVEADVDLDKTTKQFTELLFAVVAENSLVNYDRFRIEQLNHKLKDVVSAFSTVEMPEDKNTKIAFLLNAYNANVLAMVAEARTKTGFENVNKLKGFFDKDIIKVAGKSMTLNDLENKHIRSIGDARIHAALVCAAMSCPPLRNEAFQADKLDEQLDDQSRLWVNDTSRFTVKEGKLAVSSILDWYQEDFDTKPYNSPAGFVKTFADSGSRLGRFLEENTSPAIIYLEYDWSLNHQPN